MLGGILARGVFAVASLVVFGQAYAGVQSDSSPGLCGLEVASEGDSSQLTAFERKALEDIRSRDNASTMGLVVSRFDRQLGTRLYFAASLPNADGEIPLVDANAHSVLVYFHGSGTAKAGGKNLLNRMPHLIGAGVAPVSLDLPFHSEGPFDSQLENIDYFMEWIHKLVTRLKAYGKPIYMMGHSFGPFVIQEYAARHPEMIKGALLISAAGEYHPALEWTYRNITMPGMKYIDENLEDYLVNEPGGFWADKVQRNAIWPRLAPPQTKMIFLRGEDDEWFPENRWLAERMGIANPHGPRVVEEWLQKKYPQAEFVFKPGFGHYIFEATGPKGGNLITETLFGMMGIEGEVPHLRLEELAPRVRLAALHANSSAFRTWAANRYRRMITGDARAKQELEGWTLVQAQNWLKTLEAIPTESPDFYQRRVASWHRVIAGARRRVDERDGVFEPESQIFAAEYGNYLRKRAIRNGVELGEDPLLPKLPPFGTSLQGPRSAGKWGVDNVFRFEDLQPAILRSGGEIESVIRHQGALPGGQTVLEVRYHTGNSGPGLVAYVIEGVSEEEMKNLIRAAYHQASSQIQYRLPSEKWEGTLGNWKIIAVQKSGKLEHLRLVPQFN